MGLARIRSSQIISSHQQKSPMGRVRGNLRPRCRGCRSAYYGTSTRCSGVAMTRAEVGCWESCQLLCTRYGFSQPPSFEGRTTPSAPALGLRRRVGLTTQAEEASSHVYPVAPALWALRRRVGLATLAEEILSCTLCCRTPPSTFRTLSAAAWWTTAAHVQPRKQTVA